eukprot:scaffold762_cov363-Pavlova_lutheri.AAC.29
MDGWLGPSRAGTYALKPARGTHMRIRRESDLPRPFQKAAMQLCKRTRPGTDRGSRPQPSTIRVLSPVISWYDSGLNRGNCA